MKYYDEERMRRVRATLESDILNWPGVASKEMMGCLCYFRGKRFFAFLITGGVVVTKLAMEDRAALSQTAKSKPFEMAGRTASSWVQCALKGPADLRPLMPYIRKSYDAASGR